ncbi:hypothetical protein CPB85DRAFT_1333207, partial [Mucidula mucida]
MSRHSGPLDSDTPVARAPLKTESDEVVPEDEGVEVIQFPSYSDAGQNLSSRIANHIVSMRSDVDVAVVDDEAWISVVNEDDSFQSDDDEDLLFREVLNRYDIDIVDGIARLRPHPGVNPSTSLPSPEHLNRLPIPPLITLPRYPNALEPKDSSPDMWETGTASAALRPSRRLGSVDSGGDAAPANVVEEIGEPRTSPHDTGLPSESHGL